MAEIVDLDHKWATLIGRVFMAFGTIEKLTHECLKEWLKDPIYDHLKKIRLSQRIDMVIDLIGAKPFEEKNIVKFVLLMKEAKKLAEKRNILAHNPLLLTLFYGDPDFHEIIQHNFKENKYVTFDELKKIVKDSEMLATELIETKVKIGLEGRTGLSPP